MNEREAFVEFVVRQFGLDASQLRWHGVDLPIFGMREMGAEWLVWQARAALSSPAPDVARTEPVATPPSADEVERVTQEIIRLVERPLASLDPAAAVARWHLARLAEVRVPADAGVVGAAADNGFQEACDHFGLDASVVSDEVRKAYTKRAAERAALSRTATKEPM